MISDLNSDRCKFEVSHANTLACREELFPTAVAERLLVNVWRWGLKLLCKTDTLTAFSGELNSNASGNPMPNVSL